MTAAARTVLLTLGLLFVLAPSKSPGQSHADQSSPAGTQKRDDGTQSVSSQKSDDAAQSASTPGGESGNQQTAVSGAGTASSTSSTKRVHAHKLQSKSPSKPPVKQPDGSAVEPSLRDTAREMLQSLDAAIQVARRSGIAAPTVGWESKDQPQDGFAVKREELRAQLDAAKSDQAVDGVVSNCATALNEVLSAIAANDNAAQPETRAKARDDDPTTVNSRRSSSAIKLSLYMAGTALVVSLLALWRAWFVSRREVNKVLIDAGLL